MRARHLWVRCRLMAAVWASRDVRCQLGSWGHVLSTVPPQVQIFFLSNHTVFSRFCCLGLLLLGSFLVHRNLRPGILHAAWLLLFFLTFRRLANPAGRLASNGGGGIAIPRSELVAARWRPPSAWLNEATKSILAQLCAP